MGQIKYVSLALAAVAVVSIVVGGISFSSVAAERGVQVNVVDDDRAYLGLEQVEQNPQVDTRTTIIEVSNQFSSELALRISQVSGTEDVELEQSELTIGAGESADLDVTCTESGERDVTLNFVGSAAGSTVDATRTYTIDCQEPAGQGTKTYVSDLPGVEAVSFLGAGQVTISGNATDVAIELTYENGSDDTTRNLPITFLRGTSGANDETDGETAESGEGAICSVTVGVEGAEETYSNPLATADETAVCAE